MESRTPKRLVIFFNLALGVPNFNVGFIRYNVSHKTVFVKRFFLLIVNVITITILFPLLLVVNESSL